MVASIAGMQGCPPSSMVDLAEVYGIAEIDESPKAEAEDNFSPRSVLTPWRRATPVPTSASRGRGTLRPNQRQDISHDLQHPQQLHVSLPQLAPKRTNNPEWRAVGSVRSEYNFLYLPIDFRTKYNKGYASAPGRCARSCTPTSSGWTRCWVTSQDPGSRAVATRSFCRCASALRGTGTVVVVVHCLVLVVISLCCRCDVVNVLLVCKFQNVDAGSAWAVPGGACSAVR